MRDVRHPLLTTHPTAHCSEAVWPQHLVCKYPKRRNGFLEAHCSFGGLDQRKSASADTIELERWHRRCAYALPKAKPMTAKHNARALAAADCNSGNIEMNSRNAHGACGTVSLT